MWILVAFAACRDPVVRHGDEPIGFGHVASVFPPDGAAMLHGAVPVLVLLGTSGVGDATQATLWRTHGAEPLPCEPWNDVLVECAPFDLSDDEGPITLSIDQGTHRTWVRGTSEAPATVNGWDLLANTRVTRFGRDDEALYTLRAALDGAHLEAVLDGWGPHAEPGEFRLLAAMAHPAEDGFGLEPRPPGLVMVLDALWDGEWLWAHADVAWLVIDVEGETVHLPLVDVAIRARIAAVGLEHFVLDAAVPSVGLLRAADSYGPLAEQIFDYVKLDRDLDGDGRNDAAVLRIEGAPTWSLLAAD